MKILWNNLLITLILSLVFTSCTQPKLDDKYVNIDFKNLEIHEFIKKVSEITGKEIRMDKEIKGKINFVFNEPVLKTKLIPLVNAILETKRMTLIDRGSCYVIIKSSGENICNRGTLSPIMKTVVFELDDLNSAVVRTKIKPLLSKNAKVISFKRNGLLAVTDNEYSLKMITEMIEKIKANSKSKISEEK